jgi:hypothetical protein
MEFDRSERFFNIFPCRFRARWFFFVQTSRRQRLGGVANGALLQPLACPAEGKQPPDVRDFKTCPLCKADSGGKKGTHHPDYM